MEALALHKTNWSFEGKEFKEKIPNSIYILASNFKFPSMLLKLRIFFALDIWTCMLPRYGYGYGEIGVNRI